MKKIFMGLGVVLLAAMAVLFLHTHGPTPTPQTTVATKRYVAMGDSVAAGVGLTGDSDSSACNRTNQSYPYQLASGLHYKLTNLACSGATLTAGILGSQDVNDLAETPQLQQLFAKPRPDLVTLTIGANDVGWTTILAKCYTTVCGTAADTASVNQNLAVVKTNLQAALTQIQNHYGASVPRVIVTGYHQVFPSSGSTCSDLTGIDSTELAWGRQLQVSINQTIQQATAGYSFVAYAPIDFSGHELCTADSWVQGLGDKQPYHPTAAGQAAFAKQIATALKALT